MNIIFKYDVVITTFNRKRLISRAVNSVLAQKHPVRKIIIVDDCSTDGTRSYLQEEYPQCLLLKSEKNSGPSVCRNLGIESSSAEYILILDDDDELLKDASEIISSHLLKFSDKFNYPVYQFARSNGFSSAPFQIVDLGKSCKVETTGDFLPVINREKFLEKGLHYPQKRGGGESILWWHIADLYGIPTWSDVVVRLHDDGDNRLTSVENQITNSRQYADIQETIINRFGSRLEIVHPPTLLKKHKGAATYWLLAGEHQQATRHISWLLKKGEVLWGFCLAILCVCPLALRKQFFRWYRRRKSCSNQA